MRKISAAFGLYSLFFSEFEHFSPVCVFPLFVDLKSKTDNGFTWTHNSRLAKSALKRFWIQRAAVYYVNRLIKMLQNIYCKTNCTENDWPWGERISICFGLSPVITICTHNSAAPLWLLTLSSNSLLFCFGSAFESLESPCELRHTCFLKASLERTGIVVALLLAVSSLCTVSEDVIDYVNKAQFTSIFPFLNEWNSLLFKC